MPHQSKAGSETERVEETAAALFQALQDDAFITCVSGDGRPKVVIQYATLMQAQALHSAIVPFMLAFGAVHLTPDPKPETVVPAERRGAEDSHWSEHSPQEIVRRTRCAADENMFPTAWRACCDLILQRLGSGPITAAPAPPIQGGVSSPLGEGETVGEWTCAARRQGTAGGSDPADCDWPTCGCDPYADKVIAALQECGHLVPASLAALGTGEGSGEHSQAKPPGWSEHSPAEIVCRTRCMADETRDAVVWRDCCDLILERLGAHVEASDV